MQGAIDDSIRFDLLGPLRACRGAEELDLGPARQRAVLAALLLAADRPVPPSRIVDQVWGDHPPENGTNVVQKYIAGLRRVLEPERAPRTAAQLLTLTDGGYRLSVAPGASDLDVFAGRRREARRLQEAGRLAEAAAELRAALELWRAEPLAGLTSPYFESRRAQLTEERAGAVEEWAELELEQGHESALLPELTRLIAEHPLRQRLRTVHLLALYRTGRQAEALASYSEARRLLTATHGTEPGLELQALHTRILRNDLALHTRIPHSDPALTGSAQTIASLQSTVPLQSTLPPVQVSRAKRGWERPVLKIAVGLLPVLTVSLAAAPLMAVLAVRRRSLKLAVEAVGYLATTVAGLSLVDTSDTSEITGTRDALGMAFIWLPALACGIHAALIVPRQAPSANVEQDVRRRQAREIAAGNPAVARQLAIGRPDLPSEFDDGGLIDLNTAPEAVLRTLPGVPPEHAALIIADRSLRGPFNSLEDVAARGVFPWPLPRPIADVVLVLPVQNDPVQNDPVEDHPVQDTVEEERQ